MGRNETGRVDWEEEEEEEAYLFDSAAPGVIGVDGAHDVGCGEQVGYVINTQQNKNACDLTEAVQETQRKHQQQGETYGRGDRER